MIHSSSETYSISKIMDDAMNLDKPIFCIIELTTRCNWRCKHCYLPNHHTQKLTYEDLSNILISLRQFGIHQIAFTGGELFMRKDALDIISLARDMYFKVNILSNGSLLDEDIVKRLKDIYISDYSMTMFSLNPEIHDSITGVKGSFNQLMNGINLLKKYRIPIELKTPILKENKNSFVDVYNYTKKNGFKFLTSTCIFPRLDGDITPLEYSLNDDELQKVIPISDNLVNYKKKRFLGQYMCDILKTGFAINCVGDVLPCNSFFESMGNLKEESIKDIWNKKKYKDIRELKNKDSKNCMNCQLIPYCDRCPATLVSEGKNYDDCSSISKKIAVARQKNEINYKRKGC